MLTRRGFLSAFGAALAGATLDPERLLWVPGQRTIFVPPVSGWSVGGEQRFVTAEWFTEQLARAMVEDVHFLPRRRTDYRDLARTRYPLPRRFRQES